VSFQCLATYTAQMQPAGVMHSVGPQHTYIHAWCFLVYCRSSVRCQCQRHKSIASIAKHPIKKAAGRTAGSPAGASSALCSGLSATIHVWHALLDTLSSVQGPHIHGLRVNGREPHQHSSALVHTFQDGVSTPPAQAANPMVVSEPGTSTLTCCGGCVVTCCHKQQPASPWLAHMAACSAQSGATGY
jgi:hypothetical protein